MNQNENVEMAKEMAILRLLKQNHNLKGALQQQRLNEKQSAPVQVDPYMLKQLLEEFQAVEGE